MKGGFGAAMVTGGGVTVGAVAAVNAFGDVRDGSGRIIAGARGPGGFVDSERMLREQSSSRRFGERAMQNTTLAVVIASVMLSRIELQQVAHASSAALLRRITPAGTTFDGDVVFALGPVSGPAGNAIQVETLAVAALEHAIERAVRMARGRDGIPGLADDGGA